MVGIVDMDDNTNKSSLKTWSLSIPHVPPSANKLLRMFWADYQDILGAWKHDVFYLCREAKIPKCARINVNATIYFKDRRRRDFDNFAFGLQKLLGDSLKGVVIFDDDPSYLTWGNVTFAVDKHNPRTEVVITDDPR